MTMGLTIATIVGMVMVIIGGALLSAAEFKKFLKPLGYTFLGLGIGITAMLALVWLIKLTL